MYPFFRVHNDHMWPNLFHLLPNPHAAHMLWEYSKEIPVITSHP